MAEFFHLRIKKSFFLFILSLSLSGIVFGQTIISVSPLNATINQTVIFTVSGSNLSSGMVFWIADLGYADELGGGTSSTRYFQGTFNQWASLKPGVIKDEIDGNTLFEFSVNVNEFPIVTDVVPDEAILGEQQSFTIYGTGLTNDMVYYIPDFGDGTVNTSSNTTYKTFTAISADNTGIKHSEIKDHSNGTVLLNFDVYVYFPTPQNLTATAQGNTQIDLNWGSIANTDHYKLYRATSANGYYSSIYSGSSTSYSNINLNPSTTYYYRIQACQGVDQNSCSSQSTDYVSATTGGGNENHAPDNPSFRPLPSGFQYQENAPSTIPIRSSTDQDGDQTRVHMWSANSTHPVNNPYISSYNVAAQDYDAPLTFTQSGYQTVYLQSYDINGASSSIITRNYDVLPENTDDNPTEPAFISFPSEVDLNQLTNFSLLSGTDPNGDQTQIKVWATNSSYPANNPYFSSFYDGGHQFSVPLTFYLEGTQIVYSQTIDINNNTSNIVSHSISIIDGTTTLTEVLIGNIEFTAASIVETQTNIFSLSGNVLANEIIHFTGTVILDLNDLSVSGNGRVYLSDIPNFNSDVDLYNGAFSYDVPNNSSELIAVGINEANELLSMANLPVHIDNINLLSDGIHITGEVEFPELFGYIRGSISQLQITQSQGLDLVGDISISQIQASGFSLKNISFVFNTINDEFSGSGEIETSLFEAGANVSILSTGIDEVGMFLELTNPKPLGTTGLSLSGLEGNISNIQSHPNPPMIITFGANLVPTGAPTGIVEFSDVSLTYQFGTSLTGSGTFVVLGTETASAGFEVRADLFKINAEINFYDIINAAIEAGIAKNQDNSIDVSARFYAAVTIPEIDFFPGGWIKSKLNAGLGLPLTVAEFDNILFNNTLSGKGQLIEKYKFSYLLTFSNGTIHEEFATNYSLFTEQVFISRNSIQLKFLKPPVEFTDWNSPTYTRFEGRSLIINSELYKDSKDRSGDLIQDFILTADVETVVVRVVPEDLSFLPQVTLTSPNGEIITQNNISNYENIIYSINSETNGIYYTINNASAGSWTITLVDNDKDQWVDIIGTDNEAGIIINSIQKTGDQVEVSWVDDNPDFNGQISLYYDHDNEGIDGSLIVSGISEDDDPDSYSFDVSNFSTGQYYVYAIMFDENSVPVSSYSTEPFVIEGDIAAPTNFSYSINYDGNIEFNWNKINNGNSYDYLLYHEEDATVSFGSQNINTGADASTYVFTNPDEQYIRQFMVVAQDSEGGLGEPSNIIVIDLAVYQTLYLNAGWNLIGFNVEPFDLSVEEAFSAISDRLIQVKDEIHSYDPNLPDFLNTLNTIENGKGYWVKLSQSAQLTERGREISLSSTQIQLNQGWNLISYPAQYAKEIEQALSSISGKIIQVKSINQSYDPNLPDFLNTLDELVPGKGYWVKVSQSCLLIY